MGVTQHGGRSSVDVRTLVLAVGIAGIAETLVLVIQSRLDRVHAGPGWWALGMGTLTLSFLTAAGLVPGTSVAPTVAFAATGLRAAGFAFVLVGLLRFGGGRERPIPLAIACAVPVAAVVAFEAAGELYRGFLVASAASSVVGSIAAIWILTGPRCRDFRRSALVTAGGFGLLAVFFIVRIPITVAAGPVEDPYAPTFINALSQVVRLVALLIATFGLVLMSSERLTKELVASRDRVNQAERAATIGRLAGGVAHNFNNLLHAMIAYTELVEDTLPTGDPRRADLEAVRESGLRGAMLAKQLAALGGRRPAEPAVVDVAAAVAALEPMLDGLAGSGRSAVVHVDGPGVSALVDRSQLDEMVLTLFLNAVQATPEGGTITVETGRTDLDPSDARLRGAAEPGGYVRVAVADSGLPIAPDRLSHAFDPFYSVASGEWSPAVGLSAIAGLAAAAGGFLVAESRPAGNVFSLFLPAVEGTSA